MKIKKTLTIDGLRIPYDEDAIYIQPERWEKYWCSRPDVEVGIFMGKLVDAFFSVQKGGRNG